MTHDAYMEDYDGGSLDISFCFSDCRNASCRRCMYSKTYKRIEAMKDKNPWYIHTVSDFSKRCDHYRNHDK